MSRSDPEWNYADVFEAIADATPSAIAIVQGARRETWSELDQRADLLAADLLDAGLAHQSKVAVYLQNCPEYLETVVASVKAGLVPVNTNYRYGPDEIAYLFGNADAEAVVFAAEYTGNVAAVRSTLPRVVKWYCVADHTGTGPDWAVPYERVVGSSDRPERVQPSWGRSGNDLILLYTGGTTGMPKGVMWQQHDLFCVLGRGGHAQLGYAPVDSLEELVDRLGDGPGPSLLPACPLMHGTGLFFSLIALSLGGSVVLSPPGHFDAASLWDTVATERVRALVIVGDAFARPMLAALRGAPGRRDLSDLTVIISSGVMWSEDVKAGLLEHVPDTVLVDSYGSSEALSVAASVTKSGTSRKTATFRISSRVGVFDESGRRVEPGSGEHGLIGITGHIPIGYYKDPEKSAATFRTFDGVRYSIPGDWATVDENGVITLLGRGSTCINTGGEKVFPEEVEEVLKRHPTVEDAVVVGLPDERFGESVCALVELATGRVLDVDDLRAHCHAHLADYKAPRRVFAVDSIMRAPNGKVDYAMLKRVALARMTRPLS